MMGFPSPGRRSNSFITTLICAPEHCLPRTTTNLPSSVSCSPGVRNYNVAVTESEGHVVFLHKIVPGGADRSYGIHVAQLAGLPRPVIQRAASILKQLEASSAKAVQIQPDTAQQMALFPETNPLLEELKKLDINTLSPIEALNKLYEWKRRFLDEKGSFD